MNGPRSGLVPFDGIHKYTVSDTPFKNVLKEIPRTVPGMVPRMPPETAPGTVLETVPVDLANTPPCCAGLKIYLVLVVRNATDLVVRSICRVEVFGLQDYQCGG